MTTAEDRLRQMVGGRGVPNNLHADVNAVLNELVDQRRRAIQGEYDRKHLHELVDQLRPLCPCGYDEPLQECPIHGDGKTFVDHVQHLEAEHRRLRYFEGGRRVGPVTKPFAGGHGMPDHIELDGDEVSAEEMLREAERTHRNHQITIANRED